MKTALISDIHGNLDALEAVLEHIETMQVDRIICLGDIIGYGPNPNECVSRVSEAAVETVLGNHDSAVFAPSSEINFNSNALYAITWTHSVIHKEALQFLNSLPMKREHEDITIVHATPYDPYQWFYISSIEDALFNFNFFKTKFCFNGHTHVPGIIELSRDTGDIRVYKEKNFKYDPREQFRYIVNVGSVGQPRDGDNRACYAILNTDTTALNFHRIPYDIESYQNKMRDAGMPEFLIRRVQRGK
ncbi:MAG: metallophosphoesterase family protein [Fibrobacterota bacterium]